MYTDSDDSREKIPPQKIGTRAELVNATYKDGGELENFMAKINWKLASTTCGTETRG